MLTTSGATYPPRGTSSCSIITSGSIRRFRLLTWCVAGGVISSLSPRASGKHWTDTTLADTETPHDCPTTASAVLLHGEPLIEVSSAADRTDHTRRHTESGSSGEMSEAPANENTAREPAGIVPTTRKEAAPPTAHWMPDADGAERSLPQVARAAPRNASPAFPYQKIPVVERWCLYMGGPARSRPRGYPRLLHYEERAGGQLLVAVSMAVVDHKSRRRIELEGKGDGQWYERGKKLYRGRDFTPISVKYARYAKTRLRLIGTVRQRTSQRLTASEVMQFIVLPAVQQARQNVGPQAAICFAARVGILVIDRICDDNDRVLNLAVTPDGNSFTFHLPVQDDWVKSRDQLLWPQVWAIEGLAEAWDWPLELIGLTGNTGPPLCVLTPLFRGFDKPRVPLANERFPPDLLLQFQEGRNCHDMSESIHWQSPLEVYDGNLWEAVVVTQANGVTIVKDQYSWWWDPVTKTRGFIPQWKDSRVLARQIRPQDINVCWMRNVVPADWFGLLRAALWSYYKGVCGNKIENVRHHLASSGWYSGLQLRPRADAKSKVKLIVAISSLGSAVRPLVLQKTKVLYAVASAAAIKCLDPEKYEVKGPCLVHVGRERPWIRDMQKIRSQLYMESLPVKHEELLETACTLACQAVITKAAGEFS